MAASNTMTNKYTLPGGIVVEEGTWTSSGGTTTLTITADATEQPEVSKLLWSDFTVNGDTNLAKANDGLAKNQIKLTFTANEGGEYRLFGQAA